MEPIYQKDFLALRRQISMDKFSAKQMLLKGVKYLVLFTLPYLVDQFVVNYPQMAQLSLGALLVMFTNYAKVRMGARLP